MLPSFIATEIEAMDAETRLRNLCHQLTYFARLGQNFGYRGGKVRYHAYLPDGFSILKWGRGMMANVQLCKDGQPVTRSFKPGHQGGEMYATFAEVMGL